jgi:hypothetical protein
MSLCPGIWHCCCNLGKQGTSITCRLTETLQGSRQRNFGFTRPQGNVSGDHMPFIINELE